MVVFNRSRKEDDYYVNVLKKEAKKLRALLKLVKRREKEIKKLVKGLDVKVVDPEGRDVEKILEETLRDVEVTLLELMAEKKLLEKGVDAKVEEGVVIVRDERAEHYTDEAKRIRLLVKEVKESLKRGKGAREANDGGGGGSRQAGAK